MSNTNELTSSFDLAQQPLCNKKTSAIFLYKLLGMMKPLYWISYL